MKWICVVVDNELASVFLDKKNALSDKNYGR